MLSMMGGSTGGGEIGGGGGMVDRVGEERGGRLDWVVMSRA